MNSRLVMKRSWPLLLLMVLCLGWYLACFDAMQVGQQRDDASYVTVGRSLATGHGYRMIVYPDAPLETKYPPLLPLMIAALFRLFGDHLWLARLPALLSMLAALPVLWALLRRFVEGWGLWVLVALVGLHPGLVWYVGTPMTEAPSLLLTWLALLLLLQAHERRQVLRYVLAGAVLGLGLLLRVDFIALTCAAVLWLALARQWRPAGQVALPAGALFAPWVWHVWAHGRAVPPGDSNLRYLAAGSWDPASSWPLRVWHGFVAYAFQLIPKQATLIFGQTAERVADAMGLGAVVTTAAVVVGLAVIVGFARSWRMLPPVISLFVGVRLAMLMAYLPVLRFLLPVLPFLFVYFVLGLTLWRRPRRLDELRRPLAVVCLLIMVPVLVRDAVLIIHPPRLEAVDAVEGGALIARCTAPGAIVTSNSVVKPFALYSGRLVVEPRVSTSGVPPDALLNGTPQATHLLLVGPPVEQPDVAAYLKSPRLKLLAEKADRNLWLFAIRQ